MTKPSILAIPGSLREASANHSILKFIGALMPVEFNYHIYGHLADIPPFDPGMDNDQPPQSVQNFRGLISQASAILICTPEYAFGVPGQLKNALDWTVSSGSFVDKPISLITASLGGENAHAAMKLILGAINATLLPDATLLISFIRSKMDSLGNIADEEAKAAIANAAKALITGIVYRQ